MLRLSGACTGLGWLVVALSVGACSASALDGELGSRAPRAGAGGQAGHAASAAGHGALGGLAGSGGEVGMAGTEGISGAASLGEIWTFYGRELPSRDNFESVARYASSVGPHMRVRFDDVTHLDGGPQFDYKLKSPAVDLVHLSDGSAPERWNLLRGDGQRSMYELTELANEEGWEEAYPAEVLARLRTGQELYGLPLTTFPNNLVVYNEAFFEKHASAFPTGVFPPRSWSDFERVLEIIKTDPGIRQQNSGRGVVPLALAEWLWWPWVWGAVVPASAGAEFHRQFWSAGFEAPLPDAAWVADEPLGEAFRRVAWLYCGDMTPGACIAAQCPSESAQEEGECSGTGPGYVNQDAMAGYASLDPQQLVARLVNQRAALLPMWWGTAEHLGMAARKGVRLGAFPLPGAPGADELAVITFTSLVHSRNSPNPEGTRAFLRTLMSEAGQLTFLGDSGTTLRRVNLEDPRLTPFGRTTATHLRTAMDSGSLVLSASNTEAFEQCPSCWPAYSTAWVLWHDASAEALLAHARERYTVLKSRAEKNPGE